MITRSERSGEKRNRIFSPGRRNRREKKLPFRLSFITKGDGGRVYPFTRFVNGEEAVLEESAGVSLVENQDIWLRFDGPPDFRFTMDGLDVVTLPHAEKIDGQSYLRPGWKGEPFLLFEGERLPACSRLLCDYRDRRGKNMAGAFGNHPQVHGTAELASYA